MSVPPLRLLTRDNGVGLSRDLHLLADGFDQAGLECERVAIGGAGRSGTLAQAGLWAGRLLHGRVDTQIFIERVYPRCLSLARRNLLLPNPEWLLDRWKPLLQRFDRVLCKTRHAQRLFDAQGCRTEYIGFTSQDRYDPDVLREPAFFHLAGASEAKGTDVLLDAWRRHPEWPRLTVVQAPRHARPGPPASNIDHRIGYLDDSELRMLQNRHLFHACPSEVEGYGHHLIEAMSVGAVVLATDGEPMNEHVNAERGVLIDAVRGRRQGLALRYRVSVQSIEDAVERSLALAPQQRERIGAAARAHFLASRRSFHARLGELAPDLALAGSPGGSARAWQA